MTHYERFRAALDKKPADRIPYDFSAEPYIWKKLEEYFETDDRDEILDKLGVDRRTVGPKYIGPPLKTFEDGSYEIIVSGGPRMKEFPSTNGIMVESEVYFPWSDVETPEDLEGRWGWDGKKEWWDFSYVSESIERLEERGDYWITAHGDPSGL